MASASLRLGPLPRAPEGCGGVGGLVVGISLGGGGEGRVGGGGGGVYNLDNITIGNT